AAGHRSGTPQKAHGDHGQGDAQGPEGGSETGREDAPGGQAVQGPGLLEAAGKAARVEGLPEEHRGETAKGRPATAGDRRPEARGEDEAGDRERPEGGRAADRAKGRRAGSEYQPPGGQAARAEP